MTNGYHKNITAWTQLLKAERNRLFFFFNRKQMSEGRKLEKSGWMEDTGKWLETKA